MNNVQYRTRVYWAASLFLTVFPGTCPSCNHEWLVSKCGEKWWTDLEREAERRERDLLDDVQQAYYHLRGTEDLFGEGSGCPGLPTMRPGFIEFPS
jgi:hypothetical protein